MILKVPSSTNPDQYYFVDLIHRTCTCKGFATHKKDCKHILHVDELNEAGELELEKVSRDEYNQLFKDASKGKTHFNMKTNEGKKMYELMEELSKTRLSKNFIMRDFLHSNFNSVAGICNYPEDVDQVIKSGKALCEKVLEPILAKFGPFGITFGYQCRAAMELDDKSLQENKRKSSPHHWDRGTFGPRIYARVDIWPYCVEDGEVSKEDFARWCMMNLDIDLFMMWQHANIFCITISPRPRRVWLEWVPYGKGEGGSNKVTYMGEHFWQNVFPKLAPEERPKFYPSMSDGKMFWPK